MSILLYKFNYKLLGHRDKTLQPRFIFYRSMTEILFLGKKNPPDCFAAGQIILTGKNSGNPFRV